MDATTVGIDLAKDVFQVAISPRGGHVATRRRLSRRQFNVFIESLAAGTTVVMEACSMAHYWGRRCQARGAIVRLLPAQYVRPYVRRDKTDRTDADALLEAHRCAAIHAVPIKSAEHQTLQALHRVRQQWQSTRTRRINLLRALVCEHGLVFPTGAVSVQRRLAALIDDPDAAIPGLLRTMLRAGLDEIRDLEAHVSMIDRELQRIAREHPVARRLQQIPGVGVITATAFVGAVPHIQGFRRGRHFASWLGLTPLEYSSGHQRSLGHISKRGDCYLRCLLVHGARAVLRVAELRVRQDDPRATRFHRWAAALATRSGRNRAAVAVANKLARFIWAVWTRDEDFAVAA
jgi:transposase